MSEPAGQRSFRGSLLLAFAQRHTALAIRMLALIALSRVLGPRELGLFLMAFGLVTLVLMLADFGVQQYLVSSPEPANECGGRALAAGLVTTTLAIGATIVLTYSLPSRLLAAEVRTAILIMVLASVATPVISVAKGLMQRELRYAELAVVNVSAALANAVTAIGLAWSGAGYLSLVAGVVAEAVVTLALALVRQPPPKPRFREMASALSFGSIMTAVYGIKQVADSALPLQIEASLGLAAVGLVGRAQGIIALFDKLLLDSLSHVMLAALAQKRRGGGDVGAFNDRMAGHLAVTAWPFFGLVMLTAPQIVAILLGPLWVDAVRPLQILCLGGLFLPFHAFLIPYATVHGEAGRLVPWLAVIQLGRIGLVFAAAGRSLDWVCVVLVLERIALAAASLHLQQRLGGRFEAGIFIRSAAVAGVTVAGAAISVHVVGPEASAIVSLATAGISAALAWAAGVRAFGHPIGTELSRSIAYLRPLLTPRRS